MRFIRGIIFISSSVSPELDTAIKMSFFIIMPRSPWTPSAGWRKNAGVPVEASVEAIFWQYAAFAHAETTTLPVVEGMSTALEKLVKAFLKTYRRASISSTALAVDASLLF